MTTISDEVFRDQQVGLATTLAFFVGLIEVRNTTWMKYKTSTIFFFKLILWLFRLGFITTYMTEPFINSLNVGAAVQIFSSQVPSAFGVKNPNDIQGFFKLPRFYVRVIGSIVTNINWISTAITFSSIIVLLVVKKLNERYKSKIRIVLPIEFILVCQNCIVNLFKNY
jgi:MFS superfamily sulfate permease-like transporter